MNFIPRFDPQGTPTRTLRRNLAWVTALGLAATSLLSIAVLTGCGGSKSSESTSTTATRSGRATITVTWPEQTRLIPTASNSIVVRFFLNGTLLTTNLVARPSSGNQTSVTVDSLPVGTLVAKADAYPTTDGTGTIQATAQTEVAITANQNAPVSLTMASTITSLKVTPETTSVAVGGASELVVSGLDATGAIVLTAPSKITYVSSNTSVATVSSTGGLSGVAAGTATVTVTETESGKTGTATVTVTTATPTPTPTPTATPTPATGSTIVDLANAYINSLSATQQSVTVVSSSAANAVKWSNLPASPNSDGTTGLRNGVAYSSLTDAQKTAWTNLVNAALSANGANGLTQESNIRAADAALRANYNATGYSGDYQYVAFVGTPSTSGNWMLQVGGHHNAHNYYYTGNTIDTSTPYHIATEPTSFTLNGTSYTPLADQKTAVTNLLSSLDANQLSSAKLSNSFNDIYLGAGQDARSNFPTGTTGRGVLVSSLNSTQQALVKSAIAAWVKNSPLASTYQALYESELGSTYVAYAGNSSAPGTVFTASGDYLRIDGPHVWIEFACQGGIVVQGQIHYHTIWRDRVTDYNAEVAGWTLTNTTTSGGGGGGTPPGGGGTPPGG